MLSNYLKRANKCPWFVICIVLLFLFCPTFVQAGFQPDEEATIRVFEQTSSSVVFIKNASLQWDWFSTYMYEVPQGAGSGFIWDTKGHIVTNFHVIYQADKIEVILSDQQSYEAEVVGVAPEFDLAVLKINAPAKLLKAILIGDSKDLKVGQRAISIGNPFGLDYSLTTGVISALGRSMRSISGRKIQDVIQTDAAINPGNSGGPLLDSSGNLIGVSTMIYSPSGASAGVGFAIPVNTVKRVVPHLIEYGKFKKAGLGVVLVPDNIRERLRIKGALIMDIQRGGAADQAGLKASRRDVYGNVVYGDIIISLNDRSVKDNDELVGYFDDKNVGDKVNIKFLRGNKEYGTSVVLQELGD